MLFWFANFQIYKKICLFYFRNENTKKFCLFALQVYPGRDITNIVESSHYQKIGGWCRQGALNAAKCKGAQRWIKPFRCLGELSRKKKKKEDAILLPAYF